MNHTFKTFCASLLSLSLSLHGMEPIIQFPPASVIRSNLERQGYRYFVNETNIDRELANQKKNTLGVVLAVNTFVVQYNDKNKDVLSREKIFNKKIIDAIFKEDPRALYYLE